MMTNKNSANVWCLRSNLDEIILTFLLSSISAYLYSSDQSIDQSVCIYIFSLPLSLLLYIPQWTQIVLRLVSFRTRIFFPTVDANNFICQYLNIFSFLENFYAMNMKKILFLLFPHSSSSPFFLTTARDDWCYTYTYHIIIR